MNDEHIIIMKTWMNENEVDFLYLRTDISYILSSLLPSAVYIMIHNTFSSNPRQFPQIGSVFELSFSSFLSPKNIYTVGH